MKRAFGFVHRLGLLALILLGVCVSSCSPDLVGETYSPLSSTASPDAAQSPLVTPQPQATLTSTCNPPWPTPPAEACPWLPTAKPTPTLLFPTPTPFTPPTPPEQTPTPLPLPQPARSPAGTVLYAAFFAPGAMPSEPQMFQVTVDERGQFVIPPSPFTWTTLDDNRMVVGRLTVSPNDAYLTSVYDTEAGESVIIVDLTAAQETAYIWGGQLFNWHPNGVEFLFAEYSSQRNPGLWLIGASAGLYRLLLAQLPIWSDANFSGAAISPEGQILAYSISGPGSDQIWMANTDGSDPRLVLESNTSAIVYAWSPDGRYLLYGGEPMPETGKGMSLPPWPRLWIMDREGQNRRSLNLPWEPFGFTDQKPVWSPTGQYIAGIGSIGETTWCWQPDEPVEPLCLFQNAGVYVENIETGEVRLVARNAADPTWSPDGSLLALSRMDERGQVDVWVVDVGGNNLRRVTDTPELDRYPMWLQRK
jgi:hypothetical protein